MQVITTHINADFDSLASMLAAAKLYPGAKLVFPGAQEESLRRFLAEHPLDLPILRLREVDPAQIRRLIVVDTRILRRLGPLAEAVERGVEVHVYDHHPETEDGIRGTVEHIREIGATTTLFVELLQERKIKVTPQEATILGLGIYEDTGLLTFVSTTQADLLAAAQVLAWGADLRIISAYAQRGLSAQEVSILNELIRQAETYIINGVPVVVSTVSVEGYRGDIAVLVHKLREVEDTQVLCTLFAVEGRVHLVVRSSLPQVDAGKIAVAFGGGGHASAASATIRNMPQVEAKEKLLAVLRQHIQPLLSARQIMTSPAKTICAAEKVSAAKEYMERQGLDHLPVVDEAGRFVGLIGYRTVDKALSHGLGEAAVAEYVQTEVGTIQQDTDYAAICRLMVERHQSLLPVVDGGQVVGVVTRTDVLRGLHEAEGLKLPLVTPADEPYGRKDMAGLMQEVLPPRIFSVLKLVGEVAEELGYGAFVVGGLVRDLFLGVENQDVDVVVEQDGIRLALVLAERVGGRCKPHKKFATAVVVFPDGFKLDVATARTEYYQRPAAPPVVEQSSIRQDLYRRDFTINSLAIKLNPGEFGRLMDFFGGRQDLRVGIIRVLHTLSFVDDPARIFRAVRFEQRFGFRISSPTLKLIRQALRQGVVEQLAGPRILTELNMIFAEAEPARYLDRLGELGILSTLHPALRYDRRVAELCHAIQRVLNWYSLLYPPPRPADRLLLFLMGLASGLDEQKTRELCRRLCLGPKQEACVLEAKAKTPQTVEKLREVALSPSRVYRLLVALPLEVCLFCMAWGEDEVVSRHVALYLTKLQHEKPPLCGKDLQAMGLPPGPIYRTILDRLLDEKLDGRLRDKAAAMRYVREFLADGVDG